MYVPVCVYTIFAYVYICLSFSLSLYIYIYTHTCQDMQLGDLGHHLGGLMILSIALLGVP